MPTMPGAVRAARGRRGTTDEARRVTLRLLRWAAAAALDSSQRTSNLAFSQACRKVLSVFMNSMLVMEVDSPK